MTDLSRKPLVNAAPGESDSLVAALDALMNMQGLRHDKMIPAQVVEYNRTTNQATVQPMIMFVDVADNTHARHPIANVPVVSLGGGGFNINFPLKKGDLGWILASDRDIGQFMQSLSMSAPGTFRKHSFADSWFVPDVFRNYNIASANDNAMVIQTTDGTTSIAISPGIINITAPSSVLVTTPTATFSADVHVKGNLTVDGNTLVTGATTVNGGFNASGSGTAGVTLPNTTTIGGITVFGHGHISSSPGSRTSGGMIA